MDSVSLVRVTEALNAAWGPRYVRSRRHRGLVGGESPRAGNVRLLRWWCTTISVVTWFAARCTFEVNEWTFTGGTGYRTGRRLISRVNNFSVQESVIGGVYVSASDGLDAARL